MEMVPKWKALTIEEGGSLGSTNGGGNLWPRIFTCVPTQ